ncbi:Pvc16 family protein [Streptomyces sp. NBC_00140]|uniref:Pvc16 family protein n=1 Tax=Streptomyces sp. NBC_00140 TaxID=2975664 RepID=UPI00224E6956|nr:Pvc16 family protein [Streptomyces sp. NBC_00140]MCX5328352.1 Pvc16 family protein [Streptomyces sp. NBC_00140]
MFDDLDASLAAVLDDTGAPTEVRTADVSFAVPDKDFTPGQVTLNLFLHEVQENRVLRDDAPLQRPLAGGGWESRRAPLRVDCTYLITAWSAMTGGHRVTEEHRLLGSSLLWLSRFPVVPDSFLRGALKTPPQPFPLAATVAQTRESASVGEFWNALGIAPRPAFSLTVTVALQPFTETETFPDLEAVELRSGLLTDPQLRGRVLDPALAAVPGASVHLVEATRTVISGSSGSFGFADIPFGTYTLTVRSAGRPDVTSTVDYDQDAQVHDVILTGP